MNLTDELERIAELKSQGLLTEKEFSEAKARLLATAQPTRLAAPPPRGASSIPAAASEPARPVEPVEPQVYYSSRWSSGNLFFRDRLTVAGDGIVFRKGALFGAEEQHISYRAIASFKVDHGIFLSNVTVETSGGSQPVFINGLWKGQAKEMQELVRARLAQ